MRTPTREDQRALEIEGITPHNALNEVIKTGKMILFVRTRKVPVASSVINLPAFDTLGSNMISRSDRWIKYENVLNEDEEKALKNCAALAKSLGIELEVKDLSRRGLLRAALDHIVGNKLASKTPTVSIHGEATMLLPRNLDQ